MVGEGWGHTRREGVIQPAEDNEARETEPWGCWREGVLSSERGSYNLLPQEVPGLLGALERKASPSTLSKGQGRASELAQRVKRLAAKTEV